MHISPYEFGNIYNKDPLRTRKLLLHKREINKLFGEVSQSSLSLVPTELFPLYKMKKANQQLLIPQ